MKMRLWFVSMLESRFFIAGITIFGLLLRVALIHYTAAHNNAVFADEDDYQKLGASLSVGGPYSIDGIHLSAFRPPAEAWLIALVFHLFGPHVAYVKLAEALLLAVVPFACCYMGRSLGLSIAAANVGAALAGLHPAIAYASTTLYPTALTAAALTLGLFLSARVIDGQSNDGRGNAAATGAGLSFGLAASATTAFAPVALVTALIMGMRRRYSAAVIVAVLGTLPVLAWMARNKAALGEFTVATNGGLNLFLGANDLATPMSGNNVHGLVLAPIPTYEETASESIYKAEALAWIKVHPLKWLKLVLLRAVLIFDSVGNPATQGLHSGLAAHVIGWSMLPLLVLSAIGLFLSYRLPLAWLTSTAVLLIALSSALTITKPRFRFPCDPALCVFSVVGFVGLQSRMRRECSVRSIPGS